MKIEWSNYAKDQRHQVANYIRERFGYKYKHKFIQEVDKIVRMLMQYPNLGPIDPLFADRPIAYRSVVISGLSKMVYYIDGDIIYIAAFWDCRREPQVQAAQI